MTMAKPKTDAREFEDFLKGITADREFADKLRDGSPINIILSVPHAADADRAATLVDHITTMKRSGNDSTAADFGKLIRLACVSCIGGVNYDNVMAFLENFPPLPPVVKECLKLLGITDEQMQILGIEPIGEN